MGTKLRVFIVPDRRIGTSELDELLNEVDEDDTELTVTVRQVSKYTVTFITGFNKTAKVADICSRLKHRIGTGGTVKDGAIELQGNQVENEKLLKTLEDEGFKKINVNK
jgi:translation initiation factor 1